MTGKTIFIQGFAGFSAPLSPSYLVAPPAIFMEIVPSPPRMPASISCSMMSRNPLLLGMSFSLS